MRFGVFAGLIILLTSLANAQSVRTENFIVSGPYAQQVAERAEQARLELAQRWFNQEFPQWSQPAIIQVSITSQEGGATEVTYRTEPTFNAHVFGSPQRIIDDVTPHEVFHMLNATFYRRPLPRWLDEGMSSLTESERHNQVLRKKIIEYLSSNRGLAFNKMINMMQYPQDIHPVYAQGASVVDFLVAHADEPTFAAFVEETYRQNSWTNAIKAVYGYESLSELQTAWVGWVSSGFTPPPHDSAYIPPPLTQTSYQLGMLLPGRWRWNPDSKQWQKVPRDRVLAPIGTCLQCSSGNCSSHQQPSMMAPQQPRLQPIVQRTQDTRDLEEKIGELENKIKDLEAKIPDPEKLAEAIAGQMGMGPPGPPGEPGPQGPIAEIDYDKLAEKIDYDALAGKTDIDLIANAVLAKLDINQIVKDEVANYMKDQGPSDTDPGRRILYFTKSGERDQSLANTDRIARDLYAKGYPINIITLDPRETEVMNVPRVFIIKEKREVQGSSNVANYLLSLTL